MAKRPKRYGTGQEKEPSSQEGQGSTSRTGETSGESGAGPERLSQQGRPGNRGRASEAENWERDESLNDEDLERNVSDDLEGREGEQRRR